jgi:hypothetical protein
MLTNQLISKLISLQEQANAHKSKMQELQNEPKKDRKASRHQRRIAVLNSDIEQVIRQIAAASGHERHTD